jgi:hypothetical protein
MDWTFRNLLKAIVAVTTFAYFAWIAFIGCCANINRIQSTFLSVSGLDFIMMVLGLIGAVSCIAMLAYPTPAGVVASLSMAMIAGIGVWNLVARYNYEFLIFVSRTVLLPLLLVVGFLVFFVFERVRRTPIDRDG